MSNRRNSLLDSKQCGHKIRVFALLQTDPVHNISGDVFNLICPQMALEADIETKLRNVGLRPTRQRLSLANILFAKGERHITAEGLYEEARKAGVVVSLATIYNTLHQFTDSGLLRAISIDSGRTYFDTNTGDHHHFYLEATKEIVDMPDGHVSIANLPNPPQGTQISRVDVIVRVRET